MLTTSPHLFDDATRITAGDSCWQGRTSPDYWAFVGPFGGSLGSLDVMGGAPVFGLLPNLGYVLVP